MLLLKRYAWRNGKDRHTLLYVMRRKRAAECQAVGPYAIRWDVPAER
jgi:stage V sporulation protein SpoVS